MKRWVALIPLLIFFSLAGLLYSGLGKDPAHLPSALIGKPFPAFSLPDLLQPDATLTDAVLRGEPSLVNVWATWCAACRVEHPYLMRIAREHGVPVYGVNYKDDPAAARDWLQKYQDPYRKVIVDRHGRLGLDLGVYGAPETYVVDAQGMIRYRHVGVVDDRVWSEVLAPLLAELAGKGA